MRAPAALRLLDDLARRPRQRDDDRCRYCEAPLDPTTPTTTPGFCSLACEDEARWHYHLQEDTPRC